MLEHGGATLAESLVIAEYVADAFAAAPGGADLRLPAAPAARAAGRLAIELTPFLYWNSRNPVLAAQGDPNAKARALEDLRGALAGFDARLARAAAAGERDGDAARSGPFFYGARFSLVECALAPFAQRFFENLPTLCGVDAWALCEDAQALARERGGESGRLVAWCEATLARPSVVATGLDPERVSSSARALDARLAAA